MIITFTGSTSNSWGLNLNEFFSKESRFRVTGYFETQSREKKDPNDIEHYDVKCNPMYPAISLNFISFIIIIQYLLSQILVCFALQPLPSKLQGILRQVHNRAQIILNTVISKISHICPTTTLHDQFQSVLLALSPASRFR